MIVRSASHGHGSCDSRKVGVMSRLPDSFVIDVLSKALDLMASDDIGEFFGKDEYPPHQFPFGLWFRGHSKAVEEAIEPRVFRSCLPRLGSPNEKAAAEGTWDETNVYEHLRLRTPSHEATYHTAFDWLCLMQHYALPTRLLDWSESILSALYFAAKENKDDDGELVILNAKRLNFQSKIRPTISTPDDAHVVIRAEMATTRSLKTLECRKSVQNARIEDTHGKLEDNWIEKTACDRSLFFPVG